MLVLLPHDPDASAEQIRARASVSSQAARSPSSSPTRSDARGVRARSTSPSARRVSRSCGGPSRATPRRRRYELHSTMIADRRRDRERRRARDGQRSDGVPAASRSRPRGRGRRTRSSRRRDLVIASVRRGETRSANPRRPAVLLEHRPASHCRSPRDLRDARRSRFSPRDARGRRRVPSLSAVNVTSTSVGSSSVPPGMPREAHPARELVVRHLAPLGLATVLRLLDQAPAVRGPQRTHGLGVLEEIPYFVSTATRPPVCSVKTRNAVSGAASTMISLRIVSVAVTVSFFLRSASCSAAALEFASASSEAFGYSRTSARPSGSTRYRRASRSVVPSPDPPPSGPGDAATRQAG